MQKIDSHQHFWRLENGYYDWLTADLSPIFRDYLPADLTSELEQANIEKTILVQAAPCVEETEYLLSLAKQTEYVAGVVGWIDMIDENAPYNIARLSRSPFFKGIRPMIQDIKNRNWMLKPELSSVFYALTQFDLSFDALVKPHHLKPLKTLMKNYPELRVVINHAAKPDIANGNFDSWSKDLFDISKEKNAYCKLSGLVTEAKSETHFDHIVPYMRHIFDCFGANRIMWGSDWPVMNLACNYQQWIEITDMFLSKCTQAEKQSIWHDTATNFYRL